MGCSNKYDTDVKLETISRDHRTNMTVSPPLISHPLSTIYESYNNDCVFGKVYGLPSNYSSAASSPKPQQKEYASMTNMIDEFPLRPPLWEDITSSIQNIDPENAVMLGAIATHVKLESNDTDQLIESASTLSSSLDIKSELKHQLIHNQIPMTILPDSSHDQHRQSQLSSQLNPHSSLYSNGSISNNCHNLNINDDNNNSNNQQNTYNLLCGSASASVISHYEPYDNFGQMNNFGDVDTQSNIVAMQIHQHIHQHTHIQHSHYHVSPPIPSQPATTAQHHLQHSGNQSYAHHWQNQPIQVCLFVGFNPGIVWTSQICEPFPSHSIEFASNN